MLSAERILENMETDLNQKHSLDAADCSLLQIIRLIQLLIGDEHTGKSKEVTTKDRKHVTK